LACPRPFINFFVLFFFFSGFLVCFQNPFQNFSNQNLEFF
jgi:hypothetical protein